MTEDEGNEELRKCSECHHTWPVSELENGVCPDCLLERDRQSGRWETFTNYSQYDDAELAAKGLVAGGAATEAHILELGKGEPKIVAYVGAERAPGWKYGKAVVRRTDQ